MRTNPHILEINTHEWFNKIKRDLGRDITLADIPESYLFEIKAGIDPNVFFKSRVKSRPIFKPTLINEGL